MKKMILPTLFLSAFMMLSCSDQEQHSQDELTAKKESTAINAKRAAAEKYDYLYGIQMYYLSTEVEIKRLESEKTNLVARLENGDKDVVEQIENNQIQIEKLTRFNDYLISRRPILGPGGPIQPPKPCFVGEENNCDPKQNLSPKTLIVLGNELTVSNVIIKNMKNQLVDANFQPVEDQFSQSALQFKSDFKDGGTMYTTFKVKSIGEITIPTPVVGL